MIKFYYPSPSPTKVAVFLDEAGLDYELVLVDTRKGGQHLLEFTAIDPDAKTPALIGKFLSEPTLVAHAQSPVGAETWQELANVKRLLDEINARPAEQRVLALEAKHIHKTEMDGDAKMAMLPPNARLAAREAA